MTLPRALMVLLGFVAVAVAVVLVRAESAKASNRIQRLHHQVVYLEQRLWEQEMQLARLRGPEEIRKRTDSLGLGVQPPARDATPSRRGRSTEVRQESTAQPIRN